jgi:hypothetical protein
VIYYWKGSGWSAHRIKGKRRRGGGDWRVMMCWMCFVGGFVIAGRGERGVSLTSCPQTDDSPRLMLCWYRGQKSVESHRCMSQVDGGEERGGEGR